MLSPKGSRQKDQKRVLPAFEQSYGWFYSLAIVVYVCRSGGCAESQDSSLAADAGPVGGGRQVCPDSQSLRSLSAVARRLSRAPALDITSQIMIVGLCQTINLY